MGADDATAAGLGVATGRVRVGCFGVGAALAGAGVAMARPVAFVGPAAPHLARLSGGRGHRPKAPPSGIPDRRRPARRGETPPRAARGRGDGDAAAFSWGGAASAPRNPRAPRAARFRLPHRPACPKLPLTRA